MARYIYIYIYLVVDVLIYIYIYIDRFEIYMVYVSSRNNRLIIYTITLISYDAMEYPTSSPPPPPRTGTTTTASLPITTLSSSLAW